MRFLDEAELTGEEVLEVDEPAVGDVGVGMGLEREPDVDAEGALAACPAIAGLHDPRACAGDHHPCPASPHVPGEIMSKPVIRMVGCRPGRPEDGDLG